MESLPRINFLLLLLLLVMNSITSQGPEANEESTTGPETEPKLNPEDQTETPQEPEAIGESPTTPSQLNPGNQTNSETQANKTSLEGASKCKPNEVLTATKGCVDREVFMERVLLQAWMGESLDVDKHRIGLEAAIECQENEILTAFGCAPQRKPLRPADAPRAPIEHSRLFGKQVFTSNAGMPSSSSSKMRMKEILALKDTEKSQPRTSIDLTNDSNTKRKHHQSKPGSYVFVPGRRLHSLRRCRPYEVLARHDRCIRKLGKTGPYVHKDHIYGSKQWNRHKTPKQSLWHAIISVTSTM